MELILYIGIFVVVFVFVVFTYTLFFAERKQTRNRLAVFQYQKERETHHEEGYIEGSLYERFVAPVFQMISKALSGITPETFQTRYEELIQTSGVSRKLTVSALITLQTLTGIIFGAGIFFLIRGQNSGLAILMSIVGLGIGIQLPRSYLRVRAQQKREAIQLQLPDFLDLLYVSVEAGLGFDTALKRVASKMRGPLSDEIKRTLNEMVNGRSRSEALRGLAERTKIDDVQNFVSAVIQGEQMGTNMGSVLKIQSETIRRSKRQRAEEKANTLPVKMLFPMVFLIFPALFVVILGPALINLFQIL
ncbi:type II secretion system F family protein [Lacticigenium naphthae]|uniref:type II secretion system F family protein n=1 Tax=Lacticigenium naphthae TaxID=515351 RepID=UPI0004243B1B|nr:type II secretion system F family protein [Lacticigenium naphthae]